MSQLPTNSAGCGEPPTSGNDNDHRHYVPSEDGKPATILEDRPPSHSEHRKDVLLQSRVSVREEQSKKWPASLRHVVEIATKCATAQGMREYATATHPQRQPQAGGRMGRALVSRSYRKLEAADSVGDFLTIFADAVRAHRWTWEKHRVLHRNISTSSIMWYRDGGQVRGVLCDFDTDDSATANELHHNADARPFMAMDLLRREEGDKAVPHLYCHELEAFFYVFEYVCAAWNPDKKKLGHLHEWERGSLADIAVQKSRFLMEPETYSKIFGKAHPALAALVKPPSRHHLFYLHYRAFEHQHRVNIGIRHLRELGGEVFVDRSTLTTGMFGACYTVPEMTYERFMHILGTP